MELAVEGKHPLADVLREVAHALEVVGDAQRADDIAQVDRHWLASRQREDGLLFDVPLQIIDTRVHRHDATGERGIALGERADRVGGLFLDQASHLGDQAGQLLQVGVERLHDVFGHCFARADRLSRSGR